MSFVMTCCDLEGGRVLDVAETRDEQSAKKLLDKALSKPQQSGVFAAAMDMWPAYRNAVNEVMPFTEIGHDRFHVSKHLNEAVDQVRRQENRQMIRNGPFFIYLAYNAVHGPNHAPEETIQRFSKLPNREAIQAAMVAELDEGIGCVLKELDAAGKSANTLVFFLSDNGGLPSWWEESRGGMRGYKREQFDGGGKVPFLVRWPAEVKAGQVLNQPVVSLDILPTALEAAGITKPAGGIFDGISLLPSLKAGRDLQLNRTLYWAGSHYDNGPGARKVKGGGHDNPPPSWAVRRGPWKMMQILEQGPPMLFNIEKDPAEDSDVIARYPELAAELQAAFVDWFKIGGKPINWNEKYYRQLKDLH